MGICLLTLAFIIYVFLARKIFIEFIIIYMLFLLVEQNLTTKFEKIQTNLLPSAKPVILLYSSTS